MHKMEDGLFMTESYGKTRTLVGIVDKTGKEIVPPSYSMIYQFSEGLAQVFDFSNPNDTTANSERSGFINKSGKLVVPLIYNYTCEFKEGIARVIKDDKQGFIDKNGKVVIPIIYDHATESNDGIIAVQLNNKWGIVKNPVYESFLTEKAVPTSSKALVNGREISFDAYNIKGNNYFKLRDLAYVFSGTEKQFDVNWDNDKKAINLISNKSYTLVGNELSQGNGTAKSAKPNKSPIYIDGKKANLTAYTIDGNNYFKLRDIGKEFNIGVNWDGKTNTISLNTSIDYVE